MILTLPLPPRCLHPNARAHWGTKARATKKTRSEAALVAHSENTRQWQKAELRLTFYVRTVRARDDDNLTAWSKAVRDGIADGLGLADDNDLRTATPVQVVDKQNPRLVVEVVETE